MDNVKKDVRYYVYPETKVSARKMSGVYIKEYHPTIDLLPVITVLAIVCIVLALILGGVI